MSKVATMAVILSAVSSKSSSPCCRVLSTNSLSGDSTSCPESAGGACKHAKERANGAARSCDARNRRARTALTCGSVHERHCVL
eukprot:1480544-Pleurochrysis_carterae.AAC.2